MTTKEKWRDINPFQPNLNVCADEGYAKNYYYTHREWIYFLPKEIAVPMWQINKIAWRLGFLALFIVMIMAAALR